MVAPSALAETVTPPIFSPAAEVTVPLSSTSAASAGIDIRAVAANAAPAMAGRANCLAGGLACLMDLLHQGGYARSSTGHQGGYRRCYSARSGPEPRAPARSSDMRLRHRSGRARTGT